MKVEAINYVKKMWHSSTLQNQSWSPRTEYLLMSLGLTSHSRKGKNAIALLKLLTLSEKDKAEGNTFTKEQLLAGPCYCKYTCFSVLPPLFMLYYADDWYQMTPIIFPALTP